MINVLIIDDDDLNRDIFHKLTIRLGYTVYSVASAVEALKILKSTHFDLILLDLIMPDLSGREAISLIKRHTESPVIALSGLIDENKWDDLQRLGFDDYLAKPVFKESLAEIYRKWIKK